MNIVRIGIAAIVVASLVAAATPTASAHYEYCVETSPGTFECEESPGVGHKCIIVYNNPNQTGVVVDHSAHDCPP